MTYECSVQIVRVQTQSRVRADKLQRYVPRIPLACPLPYQIRFLCRQVREGFVAVTQGAFVMLQIVCPIMHLAPFYQEKAAIQYHGVLVLIVAGCDSSHEDSLAGFLNPTVVLLFRFQSDIGVVHDLALCMLCWMAYSQYRWTFRSFH